MHAGALAPCTTLSEGPAAAALPSNPASGATAAPSQIKRCDDMARQLRFFTDEVEKAGVLVAPRLASEQVWWPPLSETETETALALKVAKEVCSLGGLQ